MPYIYELKDWPHFRWSHASIAPRLAAARYRQGRLLGRMEGLGFLLRAQEVLKTFEQDVLKTSEIEGEDLNPEMVRSSLARRLGVDIGALVPSDRQVDGVVDMTLDATQHYAAPLTAARLFHWHALLFPTGESGMHKIAVGAWRDDHAGPMQVVSGPMGREHVHYVAPAAEHLEKEMGAFFDWFNAVTDLDLVLKAAIAHLWFVTVHPLSDGNGRIARAIADLLLTRSEGTSQRCYSMSAQIRRERNDYYNILESTQKETLDVTPWLQWFLGCMDRAIETSERELANVLGKSRFWERHAGESFNDRQRRVLNRLFDDFEGKLTSSKWARLAKCSHDTALRDIEDLVKRGILAKDAAGGRSTNYLLAGA